MMDHAENSLHPVILPMPMDDIRRVGREKVIALRGRAREALAMAAAFSEVRLGVLEKDENGAPLPCNGIHWSLTHKDHYVAAVVGPCPLGIDLEKIRPCADALWNRIADPIEWGLAPISSDRLFFRFWTAKEAVLKAVGKGLTGLDRCRIRTIVDEVHLIVSYEASRWTVAHHWIGEDHLAAVTTCDQAVVWHQVSPSNS